MAKIHEFCQNYRQQVLIKKSFAGLVTTTRYRSWLKGQERSATLMHQRKLKFRMIKMIHETNLEFIRFAVHSEQAMERRKKRRVYTCLRAYADKKMGLNPSLFTNS